MSENELKEHIENRVRACQVGVFGIGEAGMNVLLQVRERLPKLVSLLALDADQDLLQSSHLRPLSRMEIGQGIPANRGPIDGRYGALCAGESRRRWGLKLRGLKRLVLVGGLGGDTASGALPVIAREARKRGVTTIAVVGMPFDFEGASRNETAQRAIAELENSCNGVVRATGADIDESTIESGTYAIFRKCDEEMAQLIETVCDLFMEEASRAHDSENGEGECFEEACFAVSSASAQGGLAPRNAFFKAVSRSSSWKVPLERNETVYLTVRSSPLRENALEQVEALLMPLVRSDCLWSRCIEGGQGDDVRVTLCGINRPIHNIQEFQHVESSVTVFPAWTMGGSFASGMEEKN